MALAKCARCKKVYNRIASPICPKCEPDEDADFNKIHHILAKQPGLHADAVALAAEVSIETVLRMLDGGRLRVQDDRKHVACGRCGEPAISRTKRLCEACLVEMDRECAAAMRELQKDFSRGPKRKHGTDVLSEKRSELQQTRRSDTLKRASELEERAHPAKRRGTVARTARDKKDRRR